jgi:hypothetical protein
MRCLGRASRPVGAATGDNRATRSRDRTATETNAARRAASASTPRHSAGNDATAAQREHGRQAFDQED